MAEKIRILFLSANPWTTSRILVDEEAREVFEKLQEGPCRDEFELHKHAAIRTIDLQRLLMLYEPHIVHFSGHGTKTHKILLGGTPGRGKEVDQQGLVEMFALYKNHVRLVVLNACFTNTQARSLCEVIDYSVGTGKGLGDKAGVAFAGAFYRALGFGKSVREAFESAKAELSLTKMPRTKGLELFVRNGISESDSFPQADSELVRGKSDRLRGVSDLFAAHLSDYDIRRAANALLHEEGTESPKGELALVETTNADASSKSIRHKKECNNCAHAQAPPSLMRTESEAGASEVVWRGERRSVSVSTLLREARRANARPSRNGIKPQSSTGSYVSVTINVQRVVMGTVTGASETQRRAKKVRRFQVRR